MPNFENRKELAFEDRIEEIEKGLTAIQCDLLFIKDHIVKSADVIEKVGAEVMPTINQLLENPMLKMLMKKSGK